MNAAVEPSDDLGFRFRVAKNGEVQISRSGKIVTTLRGHDAIDFCAEANSADEVVQQHLMARLTGNYKRGNERKAIDHPRNQR